jgi:hypothetical protein
VELLHDPTPSKLVFYSFPLKPERQAIPMKKELKSVNTLVFSYLTLRATIGILGMAFPFVVALGALILFHTGFQSSISSYYHTGMRDVFVGVLWAIGFFLLSYQGYGRADNIAGNLACVFAVGVSLFPTTPDGSTASGAHIIGNVHLAFSALFFLTLVYFSLVLFTKTSPGKLPTERKLQRNIVYKTCGYTMGACILLIAIYHLLPVTVKPLVGVYRPVYWLEALAIFTFGISWFTKGEAILKDED